MSTVTETLAAIKQAIDDYEAENGVVDGWDIENEITVPDGLTPVGWFTGVNARWGSRDWFVWVNEEAGVHLGAQLYRAATEDQEDGWEGVVSEMAPTEITTYKPHTTEETT